MLTAFILRHVGSGSVAYSVLALQGVSWTAGYRTACWCLCSKKSTICMFVTSHFWVFTSILIALFVTNSDIKIICESDVFKAIKWARVAFNSLRQASVTIWFPSSHSSPCPAWTFPSPHTPTLSGTFSVDWNVWKGWTSWGKKKHDLQSRLTQEGVLIKLFPTEKPKPEG